MDETNERKRDSLLTVGARMFTLESNKLGFNLNTHKGLIMLDCCDDCSILFGGMGFNELLQSIVSFAPVRFAYEAELSLNMSTLSYSFGG